jgi:cytochrome d ubiquinol oxidase subunit II
MIPLEVVWYFVIGSAICFYVVLDGFDLGVGMLHLFAKKDDERRLFLNAIGPVWDGNELWLVIVGGALFAGFPIAYATLFSTFYNIAMVFLAALIFRTVAIEFRSKRASFAWRKTWDVLFCIASYAIAFGAGLILGNLIEGIPLDASQIHVGTFADFLRPYPLLVGVLSVSVFMLHGALYLLLKTEGVIHDHIWRWVSRCAIFFITLFVLTTITTVLYFPFMVQRMVQHPIWFVVPLLTLVFILNIPRQIAKHRDGKAFISSSLSIIFLFLLYGVGTFPVLVPSRINPAQNSLLIYDAASSKLTLTVLLIIVAIGIPLVLAYGFIVYRIFRGKVALDSTSY